MAQARVLRSAWRIKKALDRLAKVKEDTIREMVGLPPLVPWHEKCCEGVSSSIRETLCRSFCPCCIGRPTFGECCCPKMSFGYRLCTDGHYPNIVAKSFLGFVFGLGLTMAIFFFLCLQFEANYEFALAASIGLGAVLSLGMAFSSAVRCLVFLALPTTCSKKGRTFLLMYAMVLIMNHPVQNFSHNLNVLTDAATCGQSLALNETKKMVEAASSPLATIISGIKKMLASIRLFADTLRNAFKALIRAVEEIVSVIASVFKWLASMVDVCNDNMGEPYRKCKKVFKDGHDKCSDALGIFDFLCDIVSLVGKVCHIARIGELLCIIVGAIKDLILSQVGPPISRRIADVKEMFYFNVSISYHYHYNMNQSRSYSEIRDAILEDIKAKLSIIDVFQAIIDNVMPLAVLLVVVKALMYRRGYLNKDNYDNVYITSQIFMIDERRQAMGKDTILPLRMREKRKFIPTFSWRLTEKEAKKMAKGLVFWSFAAFHATYYIICDYGLYWILDLVRTHMNFETKAALPPYLKLHVNGRGPMADMYKAMVGILEPVTDDGLDIDTRACLPQPWEPNWAVYKTVIAIIVICLLLTMFEAYGLRLRHAVAACYYPHREKARAIWLYNHIILMRHSFMEHTRRQLHRKKKDRDAFAKVSLRSRLVAQFPFLKSLMKALGHDRKQCMSCGTDGPSKDMDNFTHCDNCDSAYCNDCFVDLENVCTYCMAPVDYGDVDDQSVETDSSEDEEAKAIRVQRLKAKKTKAVAKRVERRPSQIVKAFQARFGLPQSQSKVGLLLPSPYDDLEAGFSSGVDDDNDDNDDEETASESTSSYDTEYQHRPASTSSASSLDEEKDNARRRSLRSRTSSMTPRPEMASMEVFRNADDSDSDSN